MNRSTWTLALYYLCLFAWGALVGRLLAAIYLAWAAWLGQ